MPPSCKYNHFEHYTSLEDPFWSELCGTSLRLPDFFLELPAAICSAELYREFLQNTDSDWKYDKALDTFLPEILYTSIDKILEIFHLIAEHLTIVHADKPNQEFMKVYEMMKLILQFQEKWVQEQQQL